MELLMPNHYEQHVLRMSASEWPDPVLRGFGHLNRAIYVPMQGPSEPGVSGKLIDWDRTADLEKIGVPTLVIGARTTRWNRSAHGNDGRQGEEGTIPLLPER